MNLAGIFPALTTPYREDGSIALDYFKANLMVLNPGGYRFKDYVKVGLPLNFLCAVIAIIVIPLVWRF